MDIMRNILLASLLSCGLSVMASGFNIIGDIPGIPDGCVVELKSKDKVSQDINTQTVAKTESLHSPAPCPLRHYVRYSFRLPKRMAWVMPYRLWWRIRISESVRHILTAYPQFLFWH